MKPPLLATYQQIYNLSNQMIMLAQSRQWDALVELEITYIKAVEKTAGSIGIAGSSMTLQKIQRNKLQQIINNETELKRLLQLRLDELKSLITQSSQQKEVNNAYGQTTLLHQPQLR
ncbi:flagellar biosynthesis protein FliT [Chania multitudinisentens RB-25]|uniref:Flagellar protein FliT n=1 Tax=Chania multitudinisentens RB-25 TaxID=1441930 RepID=W0LDZ0_9GAMM|nr:flagella biosynthesis regulatory protein FliT [Chania multitudinisentens]AHG22068.2 flagellar biosynthesis protein FliT [Chania multitudinisentens RB-25]